MIVENTTISELDKLIFEVAKKAKTNKETERRLRLWMIDCAARVLCIYEKIGKSPAPREAIIIARQYAFGEISWNNKRPIQKETIKAERAAAWAAVKAAVTTADWADSRTSDWAAARAAAKSAARCLEWNASKFTSAKAAGSAANQSAYFAGKAVSRMGSETKSYIEEKEWQLSRLRMRLLGQASKLSDSVISGGKNEH